MFWVTVNAKLLRLKRGCRMKWGGRTTVNAEMGDGRTIVNAEMRDGRTTVYAEEMRI
jgi:hypothetical protein